MSIHRCYDLTWSSETPLPELGEADRRFHRLPPDIEIVDGAVAEPSEDAARLPYGMWWHGKSFGLDAVGVAHYLADDGRRVTIERRPGADEDDVRLYLLGTVMAALMMQRDHLVLHGNAIRLGGACAIVVGHSGAGKSTLAAEFVRRGIDVLADDVVPVDAAGLAKPGYPRLKLWEDSLGVLGLHAGSLQRLTSSLPKYHVPVTRDGLEPLPVRWIYALETHDRPNLELEPVRGLATYDVLREHTYRRELIHDDAASWRHLKQCAALAATAAVTHVRRPAETMTPAGTADAILADIETGQSVATFAEEQA
jgi:hypothetical protein